MSEVQAMGELELLLSAYVDGECTAEEARRVEAALLVDEGLRRRLADHRALSAWVQVSLRAAAEEADLSGLADEVWARVSVARPSVSNVRQERPSGGRWGAWLKGALDVNPWRWALAGTAAAAAAVAVVVAAPWIRGPDPLQERLLLPGSAEASVISMQTKGENGAMLYKTREGTHIIFLTGES